MLFHDQKMGVYPYELQNTAYVHVDLLEWPWNWVLGRRGGNEAGEEEDGGEIGHNDNNTRGLECEEEELDEEEEPKASDTSANVFK